MQLSLLRDLAGLVYQYGPFGFSILFLYSISRWAYKKYDEASKENPPNPDKQKSARWIYVVSFAAGLALVAVSVAWWFVHRPLYVLRGEIRGLDHNTRISSTELYFRDRPHAQVSDHDVPDHDELFIAISESPFGKTQKFPIDFGKNGVTHDQLEIECGPDDGGNIFKPGFREGRNTLDRKADASPSFDWMAPQVVYAQQSTPQQPTYELNPPPLANSPKGQKTSQIERQFYSPVVAILIDPHSSVGERIVQLKQLQSADPQTILGYLRLNIGGVPFAATILDLTRHSDPELAYDARAIVNDSVFQDYLRQGLRSRDPGTRQAAQLVLGHMDPESAASLTKDSGITVDVKNRALVPTNFPDGDRYFMDIHWASNDKRQVDCLADFFADSLDAGGSESKEKALMRNRSQRLIYSAYPDWVVPAASKIESCGAKVSFVRPSAKEAQ